MSQVRDVTRILSLGGRDLIEDAQGVERARVADVRQELGEHIEQPAAVVADVAVGGDVPAQLRLAATEGGEHGEGEQLPGRDADAAAGEVVAEAVGRQEPLDVLLVGRRIGVERVDPVGADDLPLYREAALVAGLGLGRRLAGQRKLDAAVGEHVVGHVQEVEHLGHAHVRDGLVDDLLGLQRGDAHGERGAEHDPVLGDGLGGDHRRQLHHQPGPGVELTVAHDVVGGPVVEVLDQVRVGAGQRRDAPREQLVVVLLRLGARHESDPPLWTDEADGDLVGGGTSHGTDGPRTLAVVLRVVRVVDGVVDARVGPGEGDVALDAAGADPAGAGGEGVPVPGPVRSAGGADVQVVTDADHPHRRVRPQRSIRAARGQFQLDRVPDPAQFVVAPGGHTEPTRTSDLMARRSSIAV
jgi:hypothetical protein